MSFFFIQKTCECIGNIENGICVGVLLRPKLKSVFQVSDYLIFSNVVKEDQIHCKIVCQG